MNKTTNFNLNQWEPTDLIRPEDFNADNAILDATLLALNGKASIAVGSYRGTGTGGVDNPSSLTFDFEPKLVLISIINPATSAETTFFMRGQTRYAPCSGVGSTRYGYCSWNGNSVSWYGETGDETVFAQLNRMGYTYIYCAIG